MTDNEIIKAKEIIKNLHSYCFVSQLTYKKMGYKFCESDFDCLNNLVDEINRQQAEIERLQNESIERIRKTTKMVYEKEIAEAKSEAIKEFAERLKEMKLNKQVLRLPLLDLDVDNLVKEMTESPTEIEHNSLCETESFKFAITEDGILTIVGEPKKMSKKEYRELQYKKAQKYR